MYSLNGDLSQMSAQRGFLLRKGFNVALQNVYPCLETKEEYDNAIKAIWDSKIEGWWNYDDLIKNNVCTKEEFYAELDKSVENNRKKYEATKDKPLSFTIS